MAAHWCVNAQQLLTLQIIVHDDVRLLRSDTSTASVADATLPILSSNEAATEIMDVYNSRHDASTETILEDVLMSTMHKIKKENFRTDCCAATRARRVSLTLHCLLLLSNEAAIGECDQE